MNKRNKNHDLTVFTCRGCGVSYVYFNLWFFSDEYCYDCLSNHVVRADTLMNGATTLEMLSDQLSEGIRDIQWLIDDGWELRQEVEHGSLHLIRIREEEE